MPAITLAFVAVYLSAYITGPFVSCTAIFIYILLGCVGLPVFSKAKKVQEKLNSYLHSDTILEHIKDYIVPPALGDNAGIAGALLLGFGELENLAVCQSAP